MCGIQFYPNMFMELHSIRFQTFLWLIEKQWGLDCRFDSLTIWLEPVPSNWWRSFSDKLRALRCVAAFATSQPVFDSCDRIFRQLLPAVNKSTAFIVAKTLLVQFTQFLNSIHNRYTTQHMCRSELWTSGTTCALTWTGVYLTLQCYQW